MRMRLAAIGMALLLVLYLVFIVNYAFILIGVGQPVAIAMGVALLVLPALGAWALVAEFVFVIRGERLLARLRGEGVELPAASLPVLASGRPDPDAADAVFPTYQAATEAEPESWRAWLLLGLAYDASADRKRARWATRQAIRLSRAT